MLCTLLPENSKGGGSYFCKDVIRIFGKSVAHSFLVLERLGLSTFHTLEITFLLAKEH